MRSLIDALTKLRELGALYDGKDAEIRTKGVKLPDGKLTGFVVVLGPIAADGSRCVIRMPSSARFAAATTLHERHVYEIPLLNGAISDCDGNVQLATGEYLHQVDLIPAPCHYDFEATEHSIVHHAVRFLGVEDQCYRPMHEELLPNELRLDYHLVAQIRIDRLKPVQHYVMGHVPNVSMSFIAQTLRRAGMRLPRSRV